MLGDAHQVVAHQKAALKAHGQRGPAHGKAGWAGALCVQVEVRLVGSPGVAGLRQQLPGDDLGPDPHPKRAAAKMSQHDDGPGPAQNQVVARRVGGGAARVGQ